MQNRLLLCLLTAILFVQCQSDQIEEVTLESDPLANAITVAEDITEDVTWTSGNTYVLNELVTVAPGATLTIEPCVLVKAADGATGLVIANGADINAQGTEDCPIIFTSIQDLIQEGEIVSPNLTEEDHGLWSGIIVLGDAPISTIASSIVTPLLPPDPLYTFGGEATEDNSGTLKYVSIRHTGFETAPAERPSGLTLAGVGSGTSIDHIELYANTDDGFIVAGGTIDVGDIITSHYRDDGFDCDMGFAGTLDNIIGIGGTKNNSAMELDGGEGSANPSFTIRNATFKGAQSGEVYIEFKNKVNCIIESSYFFGFGEEASVILDRDREANSWALELIDVLNLEFNTSHLSGGNVSVEGIFVDNGSDGVDAFSVRPPDARIVTEPTVGANKDSFTGWTVADATGLLDEF